MKVKSLIQEVYSSPVGELEFISTTQGVRHIKYAQENYNNSLINNNIAAASVESYNKITTQLAEYFAGNRKEFTLPLDLQGTGFQKIVWNEILQIPYGQTRTYGEIAKNIGRPKAPRAVGLACNKNPLILIVPCHRVVGSNGNLTGYAGGLLKKQWLLKHENAI